MQKWCIIQCFTSPVSLGCCSLWIISVLSSFGFFFTCHCCEANCKSIKLHLQWHPPTLLPSHPLPPLLLLFPPHLISLAITIPSLDGNWQKLFLEDSPAVSFSRVCHYAPITSTVLCCAELLIYPAVVYHFLSENTNELIKVKCHSKMNNEDVFSPLVRYCNNFGSKYAKFDDTDMATGVSEEMVSLQGNSRELNGRSQVSHLSCPTSLMDFQTSTDDKSSGSDVQFLNSCLFFLGR